MDEVAATGEAVTITKHGKPVARLAPLQTEKLKRPPIFGRHRGILVTHADYDPEEPAIEPEAWTADVDNLDP
jgi:antitoxin (DNA-binding transcriptional repressor) of toxin-antitoxin stability system